MMYVRFALSLRKVEEPLHERVVVHADEVRERYVTKTRDKLDTPPSETN